MIKLGDVKLGDYRLKLVLIWGRSLMNFGLLRGLNKMNLKCLNDLYGQILVKIKSQLSSLNDD